MSKSIDEMGRCILAGFNNFCNRANNKLLLPLEREAKKLVENLENVSCDDIVKSVNESANRLFDKIEDTGDSLVKGFERYIRRF